MWISEVFGSIQGEGLFAGTPSAFIRTCGCNLRCWFCDTPETSWRPRGTHREWESLVEEVAQQPSRNPVSPWRTASGHLTGSRRRSSLALLAARPTGGSAKEADLELLLDGALRQRGGAQQLEKLFRALGLECEAHMRVGRHRERIGHGRQACVRDWHVAVGVWRAQGARDARTSVHASFDRDCAAVATRGRELYVLLLLRTR